MITLGYFRVALGSPWDNFGITWGSLWDCFGTCVYDVFEIVNSSGIDFSTLLDHCRDRLGKFKCPDNIHVLDDLPKGPSGKVQRLKLFGLVYQETQ